MSESQHLVQLLTSGSWQCLCVTLNNRELYPFGYNQVVSRVQQRSKILVMEGTCTSCQTITRIIAR